MTFAVAALTPYPFLESLPTGVEWPRNGIVFLADTRYSFDSGGIVDNGLKLCKLTDTAGCVIAGDVEWALWAARRAQAFFDEHRKPERGFARYMIGRRVNRMNEFLRRRGKKPRYAIAVGYLTKSNDLDLFCIGPNDGIWASTDWGFGLGQSHLLADFEESVRSVIRESGPTSTSLQAMHSGMSYAEAFRRTFLSKTAHPSIGGGLQFGVLTPNQGMGIYELAYMKAGTGDPTLKASWSSLTRSVRSWERDWIGKRIPSQ